MLVLKIKTTTLFMIIYCAIMFLPNYFLNSFTQLLSNLIVVIAVLFLLKIRYKPSLFITLMGFYQLYLILITYINKTNAADIHLIISNCKIFFFLCVIDYMLKRKQKDITNIIFYILLIFVALDFFSIVFFPDGLYSTSLIWNEWSTTYEAQWIYGNKNNRIYWYIILIMTSWERYVINGKSKFGPTVISAITILAMILVKSSTATIVAIIVGIGIFVSIYKKKELRVNINTYMLVGICAVVTLMILAGSASFLRPIVEGIFDKDMTFTNRSEVWQQAILLIIQKPLFGWGVTDSETATGLLGSLTFVNAHNQVLNCLWQGGIILFAIFLCIILCTARNINLIINSKYKLLFQAIMVGLMVDMMLEVILGTSATWVCFLLLNNVYCFSKKHKELCFTRS